MQLTKSFDDIGNRKQTQVGGDQSGANQRLANYSVNNLNQITRRDYPGANDIVGVAWATNWVRVNGQTAWRKGEYFWSAVSADNHGQAQWLGVTVVSGGNTNKGNLYFPQTPEQFSYDADGNLTNDGLCSYVWDAENRLIQMTVNTNVGPQYQLTFAYDPQGRRIEKIVLIGGVPQSTNLFLYEGWNLIGELAPNDSLIRSYVWGTDLSGSPQGAGGVGGLVEMSYAGTNCFVAYDGNGNVAALVNAADGTVAANYEYGPFGEVVRQTGPMAKANPIRFSTKYQDNESDLVYYGYRYYDPSTGKWLNRDPLGEEDGPNVYDFVLNNLVNYVDRLGLHVFSIDITAKSWIAKPIIPGYVPGGFQPMLYAAVVEVSLLTDDNVANDAIDGKYRFLSQKVISVECDGSTVKSASFSGLFTDVGLEGFYGIGLYPPPAVVVYDTHSS